LLFKLVGFMLQTIALAVAFVACDCHAQPRQGLVDLQNVPDADAQQRLSAADSHSHEEALALLLLGSRNPAWAFNPSSPGMRNPFGTPSPLAPHLAVSKRPAAFTRPRPAFKPQLFRQPSPSMSTAVQDPSVDAGGLLAAQVQDESGKSVTLRDVLPKSSQWAPFGLGATSGVVVFLRHLG